MFPQNLNPLLWLEMESGAPSVLWFSVPKEDTDIPITVGTGQTAMGPAPTTELGSG